MQEGRFLKRYKRFFAQILDEQGQEVTAHVPNTGSMKGLLQPNEPCRYTYHDDPKRKLKYTLEMIKTPRSWVGVNTHRPNQIVFAAWEHQILPHWQIYPFAQKEVKISKESRIDLVLGKPLFDGAKKITTKNFNDLIQKQKFHFVEIKNVTLSERPGVASFPDAVTTRGLKHIEELLLLMEQGHTCEMFYLVQREDCHSFQAAEHIDKDYAQALKRAQKRGLIISCYPCLLNSKGVTLNEKSPLAIEWA